MTMRKFRGHQIRASQDAALEISTQQQQQIEQLREQVQQLERELDALKSSAQVVSN